MAIKSFIVLPPDISYNFNEILKQNLKVCQSTWPKLQTFYERNLQLQTCNLSRLLTDSQPTHLTSKKSDSLALCQKLLESLLTNMLGIELGLFEHIRRDRQQRQRRWQSIQLLSKSPGPNVIKLFTSVIYEFSY